MALNFEKLNYFVYSPDYKDFIVKGEPDQTDLVLIAGIDKRTFRGHRLVVSAASRGTWSIKFYFFFIFTQNSSFLSLEVSSDSK